MLFSPLLQVRRTIRLLLAAVALALFAAGCATAPSKGTANEARPVAAGHQRLPIEAWHWVVIKTDVPGGRDEYRLEELPGVKCTATNDKGSWETIPPGSVDLAVDGGKLTIECAKAGFKTRRLEVGCSSARSRAIYGTLLALPFIALSAVAAPVAAPAATVYAIQAGASGAAILGASAGQFIAAADPDACVYDFRAIFVLQAVDGL